MAYLLRKTASGGTGAVSLITGTDISKIAFEIEVTGTSFPLMASTTSSISDLIFFSASTTLQIRSTASGTISYTLPVSCFSRNTYELVRTGGNIEVFQNGVSCASKSASFPDVRAFFTLSNSSRTADLYDLEFYDNTSTIIHKYDPSASFGTGSVLYDTVNANNAVLSGFPTDDSQWVYYDAGGADTTPPVITVPQLEYPITVGDDFTPPTGTVTDNVDATTTPTMTGSVDPNTVGTYYLYYNHTDAAGNHATEVIVTVIVEAEVIEGDIPDYSGYTLDFIRANSTKATFTPVTLTGDFTIRSLFKYPPTSSIHHLAGGFGTGYRSIISFSTSQITVYIQDDGPANEYAIFALGGAIAVDEWVYFELERVGTSITAKLNDFELTLTGKTANHPFTLSMIGGITGATAFDWDSEVAYFEIESATTNLHLSSNAAGGTGSIWPDTIGSNNATLTNFATGDAKWIDHTGGEEPETHDVEFAALLSISSAANTAKLAPINLYAALAAQANTVCKKVANTQLTPVLALSGNSNTAKMASVTSSSQLGATSAVFVQKTANTVSNSPLAMGAAVETQKVALLQMYSALAASSVATASTSLAYFKNIYGSACLAINSSATVSKAANVTARPTLAIGATQQQQKIASINFIAGLSIATLTSHMKIMTVNATAMLGVGGGVTLVNGDVPAHQFTVRFNGQIVSVQFNGTIKNPRFDGKLFKD